MKSATLDAMENFVRAVSLAIEEALPNAPVLVKDVRKHAAVLCDALGEESVDDK
jgi:hypothetical protein